MSRFAYADPPYPGQAAKHYRDQPDYLGEVDTHDLLIRLASDYDGWVLHTASTTLGEVLRVADFLGIDDFRIIGVGQAVRRVQAQRLGCLRLGPVLVKPVRKPVVSGRIVMRDWVSESITLRRGLTGAKPAAVCRWAFEVAGLAPTDDLVDLFPGTGAVSRAWDAWKRSVAA